MAKKSGQPALYEMIQNRGGLPQVPVNVPPRAQRQVEQEDAEEYEVARDAAAGSPVLERLVALARPGSTVRIPVGYMLMGVGLILGLLIFTYAIGYSGGKGKAKADFDERFGSQPPIAGVNDPLTLDAKSDSKSAASASGTAGHRESSTPGGDVRRTAADWGPVEPTLDPRQKGWNYFYLVEDSPAGALRLAEFCRENGLETYVIPGKNDRRRVIAFPGYQGSRLAPEVQALENRIHAIGDKFKRQYKLQINVMHDAYPVLYNG